MYIKHQIIDFCNKCGKPIYKINLNGGGFSLKYSCKCYSKDKVHPALRVYTPPKSKL